MCISLHRGQAWLTLFASITLKIPPSGRSLGASGKTGVVGRNTACVR